MLLYNYFVYCQFRTCNRFRNIFTVKK